MNSPQSPPPPPPLTSTTINAAQPSSPIAYATILNSSSSGLGTAMNNNVLTATTTSIINGGRQQQYHRPLLRGSDDNSNAGTLNSYDGKENKRKSPFRASPSARSTPEFVFPFPEKESANRSNDLPFVEGLPFDSYRTAINESNAHSQPSTRLTYKPHFHRDTQNYAGAHRLSDNEDDAERERDDTDPHERRKDNGQSTSTNLLENFSRHAPSSSFIDTSVRSPSNTSTIMMMMMKGNGTSATEGTYQPSPPSRNGTSGYEHRTVVVSSSVRPTSSGSSSSSSSIPVEEQHPHLKTRGYNFIPAPFNGTRLIAKSTEQLNRSFASDSLVKYCTPPSTPPTSMVQSSSKTDSPSSILKQNHLHKYTQPSSKATPNLNRSSSSIGCCLDRQEDDKLKEDTPDESRGEQRYSNGFRLSTSGVDAHRGDDFYKKLMFYEKNSSSATSSNHANQHNSNNNNNGYQTSTSSSRRSSFQPTSTIPSSTSRTFNSVINRQSQQISSRPNLVSMPSSSSSSSSNRQSAGSSLAERMQRSKSYKDLFDSPSPSSSTSAHHIYYQSPSSDTRPSQSSYPSTVTTTAGNNLHHDNHFPYYSSSLYYSNANGGGGNTSNSTSIVGSMLGNASSHRPVELHTHLGGLSDYQRRQPSVPHSLSSSNLLLDDVSSSSTVSHLPKPPPGIPSQNARSVVGCSSRSPNLSRSRRRRYKVDNLNGRQKDNSNSRDGSLERSPRS